ncbi:orotidine 5'-phosphate decarboxylase [Leuconostoc litchii]|uniref:Orotidine 5'-phosphate decarboxylase n=1 Tax=Leuconostoc litchii TaxID=1981069 RepID=A0A6P2CRK8_9LACO|nr:orotidine-5'-phosphate decarboxylase [Leuconostoc litchii]TYC46899.1 orotidine-5'-phosphate decarboxylase [Leuconostoc litchii]GMA68803.1 orotidine 5'-phosphate decarboxylase [Leuconostoc litchii]
MTEKPVFIALDFPDAESTRGFLKPFSKLTERPALKVGMELFYSEGPDFVLELKRAGYTIFLDLKLYDIPNTVGHTVARIARLNVDYLTIHAIGGEKMLAAAVANKGESLKLLAVTQLTSLSENEIRETQLTSATIAESVTHLAKIAYEIGVDGTISSALEADLIRKHTSDQFLRITPGIRLSGDGVGDQTRVTTPQKAKIIGATGLVVGRSITQAENPLAAYQQVMKEWRD